MHPSPTHRSLRRVTASRTTAYTLTEAALGDGAVAAAVAGRPVLVVTSPTAGPLYAPAVVAELAAAGLDIATLTVAVSEGDKTMGWVERICEEAARVGIGRDGVLVGVGGGVLTDLVTMAASLLKRGIGYVRVPTTLVGLIDAGIGAKGAVNAFGRKSALGCFHAPEAVVLDPAVLHTLPRPHLRYGLAEMVKIALVKDADAFEDLERHGGTLLEGRLTDDVRRTIWTAAGLLLDELEPNLYETETYQRLADFGHTFSPAVEAASGFQIHHGDAVAVDMALSTALARRLGLIADADAGRIYGLLDRLELPLGSPHLTLVGCQASVAEAVAHRGGHLNLVVPSGIGAGHFLDVSDLEAPLLTAALEDVAARGRVRVAA